MPYQIQVRNGTALAWSTANTVLKIGEIGWVTDNAEIRIGDGVTAWNDLESMDFGTMTTDDIITAINASDSLIDADRLPSTIVTDTDLSDHVTASNPHSVTATQIGLGNVTDVAQLPSSYLETSITDSDTKVPSSGAVVDYEKSWKTPMDIKVSSSYYYPSCTSAGSGSEATLSPNYLYYYPIIIGHTNLTLTGFAINVVSLSSNGNMRFGLYADTGSVYPGSLILDSGDLAMSTTGLLEKSCTSTTLEAGKIYWIAYNTAVQLNAYVGLSTRLLVLSQSTHSNTCYRESLTYTAMPSTPGTLSLNTSNCYVLIKT